VLARENTLRSFESAREHGATWLEFDVRPTADARLVVHHDPITSEGHHIGSVSAADLPDYIPLLADVVADFSDLVLDVELKTDDTNLEPDHYVSLAATEINSLTEQNEHASLLVTSFDGEVLSSFAERCPDVATGFLYYVEQKLLDGGRREELRDDANTRAITHALEVGHQAVVPHHRLVTAELMSAAHAGGLRVATWTVNTADDVRRCAHAGVDVIIGDDPRVIIDALGSPA